LPQGIQPLSDEKMKNFSLIFQRKSKAWLVLILSLIIIGTIFFTGNKKIKKLHQPHSLVTTINDCIELVPEYGPYKEAVISNSGKYCIGTDFWQKRLYDGAGHSGPARYRHLIEVRASNVVIDLANHILHSDGNSSGISINFDDSKKEKGAAESITIADTIIIRNGVIDLRGLGFALSNLSSWDIDGVEKKVDENLGKFKKTNIILENLLIKTDNMGILLEGDGNIIRNCVIESGGIVAIAMAGKNGKILNNKIILTSPRIPGKMKGSELNRIRDLRQLIEARREVKAAIALHYASNTVISGNLIDVKQKSASRHAIYLTGSSKNVIIEGNTFTSAQNPVTIVDNSSTEMKRNIIKQEKQ